MSNLSYLAKYQTFKTVREMDEAIAEHLARNKYKLNETDRDVIMMLAQYSVKFTGVSHLKVKTIAGHIGKSEITVRRVLKKIAELRIIERIKFTRPVSGGNGANIYIFLSPSDNAEMIERDKPAKPTDASDQADEPASEPINPSKQKPNTRTRHGSDSGDGGGKPSYTPASALKSAMPASIYRALSPYFPTAEELYEVYGVLLRAKASIDRNIRLEDHSEAYIDSFMACVFAKKRGKVRKLTNYLYSAWQAATSVIKRKMTAATHSFLGYDWLAE